MEAIFFTGGDPLHRPSGHFWGSSESLQVPPFPSVASGLALITAYRAGKPAKNNRDLILKKEVFASPMS
jgi:hypothetical protein